ncbi:MAG: hypothetical protein WCI20_15320, partial [bacterium]
GQSAPAGTKLVKSFRRYLLNQTIRKKSHPTSEPKSKGGLPATVAKRRVVSILSPPELDVSGEMKMGASRTRVGKV